MNNDDSQFSSRGEPADIPASGKIDQAIDRAVRRMMHVDPPAGLRRRVLSRIEALPSTRGFLGSLRTGPPRRTFFFPAWALGSAALAILVLAVVVMRDSRVPSAPVAPPSTVVAERTPPAADPVVRAPKPDAPPARARRNATRRPTGFHSEPIVMPPVTDVFGTRTSAVAATADPAADAVWTVPPAGAVENNVGAPAPLVVAPLALIPIATHPIVIAPLLAGRLPDGPAGPPK